MSGKQQKLTIRYILYCSLLPGFIFLIGGCRRARVAGEQKRDVNTKRIAIPAKMTADAWNKHIIDSAITLLRSGDLVLRTGADATSYMLRQLNRENKTFSHCGIVMMEHGYPFVYHSIGGEDNPDARLRRDSAAFFFSPAHNLGFGISRYDMTSGQVSRLKQIVAQYYIKRPKFDMDFDLATNDKLYCAEFVYKAMLQATADTAYLHTTTVFGHTFVGVDNLFVNKHARLLWQVKYK